MTLRIPGGRRFTPQPAARRRLHRVRAARGGVHRLERARPDHRGRAGRRGAGPDQPHRRRGGDDRRRALRAGHRRRQPGDRRGLDRHARTGLPRHRAARAGRAPAGRRRAVPAGGAADMACHRGVAGDAQPGSPDGGLVQGLQVAAQGPGAVGAEDRRRCARSTSGTSSWAMSTTCSPAVGGPHELGATGRSGPAPGRRSRAAPGARPARPWPAWSSGPARPACSPSCRCRRGTGTRPRAPARTTSWPRSASRAMTRSLSTR